MRSKKAVKQLMALGIQRNEAAVFARVYGKVKAARREDLFPEIILPAMTVGVVRREMEIVTLRAGYIYDPLDHDNAMSMEKDEFVKRQLARCLANQMIKGSLIEFTDWPQSDWLRPQAAACAAVKVIKPNNYI